jgi:site-specific DNA-methyltransferase (adenine-specific)
MSEPQSFLNGRVVLHGGDCREVLKTLADDSVDSVVTDPPYHLTSIVKRFGGKNASAAKEGTDGAFKRASAGFMGKQWDGGDIAFNVELWSEVLRILKPGGYILAFSSSRT